MSIVEFTFTHTPLYKYIKKSYQKKKTDSSLDHTHFSKDRGIGIWGMKQLQVMGLKDRLGGLEILENYPSHGR